MPTTSRRETKEKEQPHGQKGKEEENYHALDKIDGACESYTSDHPNLRKGSQKRTDARAHDVPPQNHARRNRAHSVEEKKKKRKRNERRG